MTVRDPVAVVEKSKTESPARIIPYLPFLLEIFQTDSHTKNN